MTIDGGAGVVPVMDINNRNNYGDGYGANWMWIIVLFAIMGGWGNGFGRNGNGMVDGAFTRQDIQAGFDAQDIKNGIRGVQNGLCDGFYAQNTTMLNGFNSLGRDLCQGFAGVNASIAENRFAAQQCCCETNRNIDAVRAENYRNTCEITNAIHCEGEKTRALITANTMQELRDKLADRDRDLQTANFQLSQQAQSANLIGALRPMPIPAYPVCSPYQAFKCGCETAGVTNLA